MDAQPECRVRECSVRGALKLQLQQGRGTRWPRRKPAVAMMEDDAAGAVEHGAGLDRLSRWVAEGLLFCPADAGRLSTRPNQAAVFGMNH